MLVISANLLDSGENAQIKNHVTAQIIDLLEIKIDVGINNKPTLKADYFPSTLNPTGRTILFVFDDMNALIRLRDEIMEAYLAALSNPDSDEDPVQLYIEVADAQITTRSSFDPKNPKRLVPEPDIEAKPINFGEKEFVPEYKESNDDPVSSKPYPKEPNIRLNEVA